MKPPRQPPEFDVTQAVKWTGNLDVDSSRLAADMDLVARTKIKIAVLQQARAEMAYRHWLATQYEAIVHKHERQNAKPPAALRIKYMIEAQEEFLTHKEAIAQADASLERWRCAFQALRSKGYLLGESISREKAMFTATDNRYEPDTDDLERLPRLHDDGDEIDDEIVEED